MDRRWIQKEGERWVEEGIISEEQRQRIVSLYQEERRFPILLPLLASLMLGAGFFSFVATRWGDMENGVRLTILMTGLLISYLLGDFAHRKGWRIFSLAWIGVGYLLFGASLYLTEEMYQFLWPTIYLYLAWSAVGLVLLYLFRSPFLFFLTMIVIDVGQGFRLGEDQFSILLFLFLVLGLGGYTLIERRSLYDWGLSISFLLHSSFLFSHYALHPSWYLVSFLLLYVLGGENKEREMRLALQVPAMLGGILLASIYVFLGEEVVRSGVETALFLIVWASLMFWAAYRTWRRNESEKMVELLLFLPLLFLPQGRDFAYLLLLFLTSLSILWLGYRLKEWDRILLSTFYFIYAILLAYFQFTWNLLPQPLFFLIGGLILFGVSFILEKKRRKALHENTDRGGDA